MTNKVKRVSKATKAYLSDLNDLKAQHERKLTDKAVVKR